MVALVTTPGNGGTCSVAEPEPSGARMLVPPTCAVNEMLPATVPLVRRLVFGSNSTSQLVWSGAVGEKAVVIAGGREETGGGWGVKVIVTVGRGRVPGLGLMVLMLKFDSAFSSSRNETV